MKFYRPKYHITPKQGWINDPNGFCFFKGQYHLFAQHNPHGLSWGPMHWLHFVSEDLIHFKEVGIALSPNEPYDREFGCFSGSALVLGDTLYLYYTGVDHGKQTQSLAISNDGIHFDKYEGNPILDGSSLPDGYLESDFRDPKVFEKDGSFYLLLSCRHQKGFGSILLFKGKDPYHFVFLGVLASFPELLTFNQGNPVHGMCECPDVVFFDDEVALFASLQFKPRVGNSFQNVHSVVYALGQLDLDKGTFTPRTPYLELDHGFDVYATQSLSQGNSHYLVYWENMWDDQDYLDRKEGYCGALSSIRLVEKKRDFLCLSWLPEFKEITQHKKLIIKVVDQNNALMIGDHIRISFSKENQMVHIERCNLDEPIRFQDGTLREERDMDLTIKDEVVLEYCIDHSCSELVFNEGEASFSLRIYGYSDSDEVKIESHGLEIETIDRVMERKEL